jgi:hypothetical protein
MAKGDVFVREGLRPRVELEEALNLRSAVAIFGALRKCSAYSSGAMEAVVDALLDAVFALPSRAAVLAEVVCLVVSEHPEARDYLPSDPSCAGHRLLLDFLSGKAPEPASRLLSALEKDDVKAFASELFSKQPVNFDAKVEVAVANGDVLLWSRSPGDSFGCRLESLLQLSGRFAAPSCARFLLSNGAKVGLGEAEAAAFGGDSDIIRLMLERLPSSEESTRGGGSEGREHAKLEKVSAHSADGLLLVEAALRGRQPSTAR